MEQEEISFTFNQQTTDFDSPNKILNNKQILEQATIANIKKILKNDSKMGYALIIAYIFQTNQRYIKLEQQWTKIPKGLCAASIQFSQQTYKCDDCGRDTNYHIFCGKCFELGFLEGLHKGHRYKAKSQRSGCCDCGDINAIEPFGYCSMHKGASNCEIQLDQDIQQRLRNLLLQIFDMMFTYIEQTMFHCQIIKSKQVDEKITPLDQLKFYISKIIDGLFGFIAEFCKDKAPLQFSISKIFLTPANQQRKHHCKATTFLKTFKEDRPQHKCQNSISTLLFKYSLFTEPYETQISSILYSLFVNQKFKLQLAQIYLQNFKFTCIAQENDKKQFPFIKVLKIYQIYCQFFGDKYTSTLITSQSFSNVVDNIRFCLKQINGQYFNQTYKTVIEIIQMFIRLKSVCEQQKQQNLALRLIGQIVQISDVTNQSMGYSFNHHKFKIYFISLLFEIVLQLTCVIKYEEQDVKQYQYKLIQSYFLNSQIAMEVQHTQLLGQIQFKWQCLPEICIGSLITTFYCKFGRDETKKLLIFSQSPKLLKKYIGRIMRAQVDAYRISKSNEVGFPGEFPPKDLYKYFYKHPTRYVFDGTITTLQILALIVPQQFIQQLFTIDFQYRIQLFADVVMQQSCFPNIASMSKIKNNLAQNSIKISMINILNMRSSSTFKDIKTTYTSFMFTQTVSFNEALQEVANFDQKSASYSIKQQYKNLVEAILIKRCDSTFARFFEQDSPQIKLFNKDNLFSRQKEKNQETLCYLLTKQITNLKNFQQFFQLLVMEIWKSNSSIQKYEYVKLVSTLFLRNSNNETLQPIITKILEQTAETSVQKLIIEVFNNLNTATTKLVEQKTVQTSKKVNRMKAHLEIMKKKQQQFINNNKDLITQNKQSVKNIQNHENSSICLICYQKQNQGEYPGFIILIKNIILQGNNVKTYLSCGHTFHKNCLNKHSAECPVCKHKFNNLFSLPPSNKLTFLDPNNPNKLKNSVGNLFYNFYISQISQQQVIQMVSNRTYFSILDSSTRFIQKDFKQLRSIYCRYASQSQSYISQQAFDDRFKNMLKAKVYPSNRAKVYIAFLKTLFIIALVKNSIETKKIFEILSSNIYSKFMACNFLCLLNGNKIAEKDIEASFKPHKQIIEAQMGEFCQGVVFAYSIIFNDVRNQSLEKTINQDIIHNIISNNYNEFFVFNQKIFSDYIVQEQSSASDIFIGKGHQSLISVPQTIHIPDNYMQFHSKYNDLKCDQCKGIIRIHRNQSWMCLHCGYKACLMKCTKHPQTTLYALMFKHYSEDHCKQGLAIDLNSSMVIIFQKQKIFQFGYIYENKFGQCDSDQIKDWKSLQLQSLKWNKLLQLLRKRTLSVYAIQNKLKIKTIVY